MHAYCRTLTAPPNLSGVRITFIWKPGIPAGVFLVA
jgi:hypothetical protein